MSLYQFLYILAAAGFILSIKWMSSPATARRGVITGEAGMLLAVIGHPDACGDFQLRVDRRRHRARCGYRRAHRHFHADDRRAAANRHLAGLRFTGLGTHWNG